jgi:hypothetical protein
MEAASRKIDTWRQGTAGATTVRIAAGTWIGWLLSRNMQTICSPRDDFRIDLYLAERRASLAHRECDIGLRAFEPDEANLAAVKAGLVAYAPFRARHLQAAGPERYIAVSEEEAISNYLRWPHDHRA